MSDAGGMITEEQYLVQEPQREYKSEFRQGRVVAMAGASFNHNRITGNIYFALRQNLQGKPCETFFLETKVKVAAAQFYTYPDVVAICEKPEIDPKDVGALLNPALIIEVLSPSTEAYDRGEKFGYYKRLESLREYVLVSQDKVGVEHFARHENGEWRLQVLDSIDGFIDLASVGCRIALKDVYQGI